MVFHWKYDKILVFYDKKVLVMVEKSLFFAARKKTRNKKFYRIGFVDTIKFEFYRKKNENDKILSYF